MILGAKEKQIILDILSKTIPEVEARVFGSRIHGNASPHSDLDLALLGKGPLDLKDLGALKEAFEESDLPFRVDVVDWHRISSQFQKLIEQNYVLLTH